jgi:hypothetical protein
LSISGLRLILVAKATTKADHTLGPYGTGNHPSGNIHLMDALVSNISISIIPKPMPVIVDEVVMEIFLFCRPRPDIEV